MDEFLSDEQLKELEDDLVNVPPYGTAPIPLVVRYTAALIEEVRFRRDDYPHPADEPDRYHHEHYHSHGRTKAVRP